MNVEALSTALRTRRSRTVINKGVATHPAAHVLAAKAEQRRRLDAPPVCEEPTSVEQGEQDAADSESMPAGPKLLLTDSEGWAGVYGEADGAKLGRAMLESDLTGEPLFTRAYLILTDGCVVPAKTESRLTPFDDDDYATATVTFRPDPQGSLLGAVAAKDSALIFLVSWRVDGRS